MAEGAGRASAADQPLCEHDGIAARIGRAGAGCAFVDAAAEFPATDSPVHAYARSQKLLMLRPVTDLVAEPRAAAAILIDHAEKGRPDEPPPVP